MSNIPWNNTNDQFANPIAQALTYVIDQIRITADQKSAIHSVATRDFNFVCEVAAELSSLTRSGDDVGTVLKPTILSCLKNLRVP